MAWNKCLFLICLLVALAAEAGAAGVATNSPAAPVRKVVGSYALTSANDFQQRDPLDWRLQASNDDGKSWVTLDSQRGELFSARHQRRVFQLANTNAYNMYRLRVDRVRTPATANSVQLAELELMGLSPEDASPTPIFLDRITVLGENPPQETAAHLFDGRNETKWLDRPQDKLTCSSWVQWQYASPAGVRITNIGQLLALRVRAEAGYQVRFEGVVVGENANGNVELLDESGVLEMSGTPQLLHCFPGQRVLVEGVSDWQNKRVGLQQSRITLRKPAAADSPLPITLEQSLDKGANFLWVEAEGTLQFRQQMGGQLYFELAEGNRSLSVSMAAADLAKAMPTAGHRVRVRGICRGGFNERGSWVATSVRAVNFEEFPAGEDDFTDGQPVRPVGTPFATQTGRTNITKLAGIRQMSLAEWRRRPTVTVRGVVTSLLGVYVQDETAGIQVIIKAADSRKLTELGDYVEIRGQVGASDTATPLITADKVVVLGRGKLPRPQHPLWGQLANGRMDSQWVEMEGVVRATDGAHLLLSCDGRQVTASIGAAAAAAVNQLVDAQVRVRGVGLAALDDWGRMQGVHILIPALKYLEVEQPAAPPFSQPIQPIATLLHVSGPVAAAHRVRVVGTLTLQDGQRLFLQDSNAALMAICKQDVVLDSNFGRSQWSFWRAPATNTGSGSTPQFAPGDRLEVLGFRESHGYSPVLTEVMVRKIGVGPVQIEDLNYDSFMDWKRDASLVRLDGVLVGHQLMGSRLVMEVVSHGRTLQVIMPPKINGSQNILPGTHLRLTGIWQMEPMQYAELGRSVGGIRLLPRSLDDVVILSRPSWWTVQHALQVIGGLSVILLAASVWITQLRRKVERRSAQLAVEIHRREQLEQQRALEAERSRIARDLHDDLGAALTQIRFLSAVKSRDETVPAATRTQLGEVSEKSHQLVTSLDEIVWAINPANDTLPKLVHYLCHVAEEFFRPTAIRCRMEVDGSLPEVTLTSEVRHNLYLTVREAMNNIAKHSQATEVWLRIRQQTDCLFIAIEDNGRGFVEAAAADLGEGLQNMRQRVEKIGGQFERETQPGQGTACRIRFPFGAVVKPEQPV